MRRREAKDEFNKRDENFKPPGDKKKSKNDIYKRRTFVRPKEKCSYFVKNGL